jgi:hypothetical protein
MEERVEFLQDLVHPLHLVVRERLGVPAARAVFLHLSMCKRIRSTGLAAK